MTITLQDLVGIDQSATYNMDSVTAQSVCGVSTDSRTIKAGEAFFAIRGDAFDGHAFIADAFNAGAACAVIDHNADRTMFLDKPIIVVRDTVRSLGELAHEYRNKFSIPIIAIGGSNGKTTTKEMIASVLSTGYNALRTEANLNNHIGVPKTLFNLRDDHEIAVVEIATNHPGELSYLCDILSPTHGLLTNIGREHLEFFKNIKGAANAEGELFKALHRIGIAFVNIDDPYIKALARSLKKKINYGFGGAGRHISGEIIEYNDSGCATISVRQKNRKSFSIKLSVPGKQAALNAFAAAVVGCTFKISPRNIQTALRNFTNVGKRMEVVRIGGVTILNDTYNANPDSVIGAIETMLTIKTSGNKIAILADMLELGAAAKKEHERIGGLIGKMGIEYVLTYGPMAKLINENAQVKMKAHYEQKNILAEYAAELVSDGDIVLVKGSRGMRMEDVVTFLLERLQKKQA
jgi:UDP-N-acetylmuramoyl-tripeptide--D-alanyl-D-alanine ligase